MRAMRRYAKEVCKAQNWKALPGFIVGHSSSMDQGDIRFSSVIPEVADVHRLGRYRKSLLDGSRKRGGFRQFGRALLYGQRAFFSLSSVSV